MVEENSAEREVKARALRAARKAAGFKSASEAAAKHHFPDAKFRSQEAGARPIGDEDAARYASAFGVSLDDLLHPRLGDVERTLARVTRENRHSLSLATEEKRQTARRLRIARVAAGYDSASAAVDAFDLIRPTYLGHENGKNSLAAPVIRLYARLFGVRESWLRNGTLPSGLGRRFDARLDDSRDPTDYADFRELVEPRPKPADSEIDALKSAVRSAELPSWTEKAGDVVRELSFADLRERGMSAGPRGYWPLPKGFVRRAFNAAVEDMIVVAVDRSVGPFGAGDRLFIDSSVTDVSQAGEFLVIEGKKVTHLTARRGGKNPATGNVVGRIVAKFALVR